MESPTLNGSANQHVLGLPERVGPEDHPLLRAERGEAVVEQLGGLPAPVVAPVAVVLVRDVLAGVLAPDVALAARAINLIGDRSPLADFTATFTVPYSDALLSPNRS